MLTYVALIHSDPNNMNSIVYHLKIVRYSMKTLHWYFPWATALHLYNMTSRGGKLQQLHCYHPFSDSLDTYLTKNHYENYSPKMVPIAKIWGPGSWTIPDSWIWAEGQDITWDKRIPDTLNVTVNGIFQAWGRSQRTNVYLQINYTFLGSSHHITHTTLLLNNTLSESD